MNTCLYFVQNMYLVTLFIDCFFVNLFSHALLEDDFRYKERIKYCTVNACKQLKLIIGKQQRFDVDTTLKSTNILRLYNGES